MKNLFSILISLTAFFSGFAQNNIYQFHLNLNNIKDDQLEVTLKTPQIASDTIIYNIPKIVPGTYQIYDFGQYVTKFKAFNKEGKPLTVNQLNKNQWEIYNAKNLDKITYWVEDTWDANIDELVFEPGGTNIETGENMVLNNHGFFWLFR
ncbi:MAG: hypothetical protein J5I47_13165 [Vicingus serpentipes]|nr:hypothetical protein [Vicingus serpentipes]